MSRAAAVQAISSYHALIRTHHISSRKKIGRIKKSASSLGVRFVLLHVGKPGLMYVESPEEAAVRGWVASVQALRYLDYRCPMKPAPFAFPEAAVRSGFEEVGKVQLFGEEMERRGLMDWFREAMLK